MGVPKLAHFLINKYKKQKFVFQKENEGIELINWFLIDTNCLIHPKCFEVLAEEQKKNNINFKSLEDKMINAVLEYIEKLVDYVNPDKGFYISIDGPVCAAKMKQQRQRRFRSVHDKQLFDKIKEKYKEPIPYYWNNSAISPGTKFMDKLHNKIIIWGKEYKKKKNIEIIYSSSNVPGEGEHKLLDFIKNNKKQNNNYSYVTYGLDADLIFLMLVTQQDNVYLLREAQEFERAASKDQLNFMSFKIMRECILTTFNDLINNNKLDKNRIINDFIFLCYFLGNDFLPHIIALDISKNGVEYLVQKYCETYLLKKDYLLSKNTKNINQTFLAAFLNNLAADEETILMENFNKPKRKKYFQGSGDYEKELFRIENLLFKINDPIGIGIDSNYRKNYYKHHFDVDDDELEEFVEKLVKHYLTGVRWVSHYYFNKIPDWNWYYSYDYPPFIGDISKYLIDMNKIKFTENKPITPQEQLLVILPPQSNYLIPKSFCKLTNSPKSSLIHLYPSDFTVDFLYKNRYWEGVNLLPPLEIKLVNDVYKKYKNTLTTLEINRNRLDISCSL
jgi:5'-3' exonuclease